MLKKKVVLILGIGIFLFATMAFAEPVYTETETYRVEVLEDGKIQVRKAIRVFKDGVELSKTYYRHFLVPEADLTNEVKRVKDIANVVWTDEVIAKYEAAKEEREKKRREREIE